MCVKVRPKMWQDTGPVTPGDSSRPSSPVKRRAKLRRLERTREKNAPVNPSQPFLSRWTEPGLWPPPLNKTGSNLDTETGIESVVK